MTTLQEIQARVAEGYKNMPKWIKPGMMMWDLRYLLSLVKPKEDGK